MTDWRKEIEEANASENVSPKQVEYLLKAIRKYRKVLRYIKNKSDSAPYLGEVAWKTLGYDPTQEETNV